MKVKIALVSLFLIPFIIISFCNQPAIDDYWNALAIAKFGRIGAAAHFYDTVSGKFFSLFLMSLLNTLPFKSILIFKLFPIVIIILLIFSFHFFYSTLFEKNLVKSELIFITLLCVALHIMNMRRLFDGLYWMSATVSYQIAIIILLITLSAILRFIKKSNFMYAGLSIIGSFILPGTTEIIAFPFIIILLCILHLYYTKSKDARKIIFAAIVFSLLGIFIAFTGKGSSLRIQNDFLKYHPGFIRASFYSLRAVIYYSLLWLIAPANVLAIFAVLLLLTKTKIKINLISLSKTLFAVIIIIFLCTLVYFPLFYFESSLPYPRITAIEFFFEFNSMLIILVSVFQKAGFFLRLMALLQNRKVQSILYGLLYIFLFTSYNFASVVKDLFSGVAYRYNNEAMIRFRQLQNCESDTCYVPYYSSWPVSITPFRKETDNTNPFIYIDKYFGKKKIMYEK